MNKERNYLNEFSLAFIEELQQGGMSFKLSCDDDFVEKEFPHYAKDYDYSLKKIYKLWRTNDDFLLKMKESLVTYVGYEMANAIKTNKTLRFFMLKCFHDSYVDELIYNQSQGVLTLKIDYDDCFCAIPNDTDLTLTFLGVTNLTCNIIADSNNVGLLISGIDYGIENGKVKLVIWGMDTWNDFKESKISFFYEDLEICNS